MTDDLLTELIQEVRTLREHIQLLWQVLDELRGELDWANNNAGRP